MTEIILKTPLIRKLSNKLFKKIISNTWVGILKIFSHSSPSAISSTLSKKVCHHQQNQFVYDLMDEKKVYVRKKSDWKCKNHIQFSLFLCSLLMWWQQRFQEGRSRRNILKIFSKQMIQLELQDNKLDWEMKKLLSILEKI